MTIHPGPDRAWVAARGGSPREFPGTAPLLSADSDAALVALLPPPPDPRFWAVSEEVRLILLDESAFAMQDDGVLELAGRTARASGRRTLVRYPFGPRGGEGGSRRERQVLATQVLAGGGLMLDPDALLPPALQGMIERAQSRPGLIELPLPDVGLFVPSGPIRGPLSTIAELDRAGRDWTVLMPLPTAGDLDGRLTRFESVAVGDPVARALLLATASADGRATLMDADAVLGLADGQAPGFVVRTRQIPGEGTIVAHLLARGSIPADAPREVQLHFWPWRAAESCTAEFLDFETGTSTAAACSMGSDHLTANVTLPRTGISSPVWAAAVVRPSFAEPSADALALGVRLSPPARPWRGPTPLSVPFWPSPDAIQLALPESITSTSHDGIWTDASGRAEVSLDGRTGIFQASSRWLSLRADLTTTADGIEVAMALTNHGPDLLEGVAALICLAAGQQPLFSAWDHERTSWFHDDGERPLTSLREPGTEPLYIEHHEFALPVTVVRSTDDRWSLAHGFEGSDVIGGNSGSSVCIHSRPQFGDLAPGGSATRRGLMLMTADRPGEIAARWRRFASSAP